MRKSRVVLLSALAACLLLAPANSFGAGFALFEHGARAVALGGAFGATADDPTALYFNPAGIAFQKAGYAAGVYFITESATFDGANPYPGEGYSVDMKSQIFYPIHLYYTNQITNNLSWGIGIFNPFGLGTWWPDDYAGKYLTKRVDLKVFDFNPNLAYKFSEGFAVAVGVDYFYSNLNLTRSISSQAVNPYTQQVSEIGQVHLYTDYQGGWGWNAAFLGKLGGGVSFGASYRSNVKINYKGNASFIQFPTGYPDFDAIVASQIPFGQEPTGETTIDYPWEGRLALAWHGEKWGAEFDYVRMGWSSFEELPITLPDYPLLSSVRYEGYQDSNTYRLGVEYKHSPDIWWQFGALYDKTPVPVESVSPLLPDADRKGLSIGATIALSPKTQLEIGYLYLKFSDRSTEGVNPDGYEGMYKTSANLLGFTLVHRF
jgi:long-chain fatty acid transport protein